MAAVLGGELGDERRLPQRPETLGDAGGGQAGELGVHKNDPAGPVGAQFVDVEVAGDLGVAGQIEPVEVLVGALVPCENILHTPQLVESSNVEPVGLAVQAHGADEVLLVERDLAVGQQPHQEQLAGLVGGEGQAHAVVGQPVAHAARAGDPGLALGQGRERLGGLIRGRRGFGNVDGRGLGLAHAVECETDSTAVVAPACCSRLPRSST